MLEILDDLAENLRMVPLFIVENTLVVLSDFEELLHAEFYGFNILSLPSQLLLIILQQPVQLPHPLLVLILVLLTNRYNLIKDTLLLCGHPEQATRLLDLLLVRKELLLGLRDFTALGPLLSGDLLDLQSLQRSRQILTTRNQRK